MTSKVKSLLLERGKKYISYCTKPNYLEYKGNRFLKTWFGKEYHLATGRVMIDILGSEVNNPNYGRMRSNKGEIKNVSKNMYHCFSPYINGYSLNHKKGWGEFFVNNLSTIQFRDDAFDHLVIPSTDENEYYQKKDLIKSLILNKNENNFQDVIGGKGGGLIFLLHGPPGVGKTLTAEATAEIIHRPLYSVSVGELGNTPGELESALGKILEIASSWNAVILFDEADVYLEKRNSTDVTRNALVGVFLRLLEYHNGIIFMTTNRVKNFDMAIFSRISLAFFYDDLTQQTRQQIWNNLLKSANIQFDMDTKEELIKTLSNYDINGRQIKNAIRLSQSLALSKEENVNRNHLEFVIKQILNMEGFDKSL